MGGLYGKGGFIRRLKANSPKGNVTAWASVVYLAPYAIYVHENLNVFHPNGEAKFVEVVFRRYRKRIKEIIAQMFLRKRSTREASVAAARFVLDKSREIVPVDTGLLRNSGTVIEGRGNSGGTV